DNGDFLVVRHQTMKELNEETARTHKALRVLFDNPTKVWKWMVLATAPRYFVNNVIGNGLMYAMAGNPIGTTRAMSRAILDLHGERTLRKGMTDIEAAQRNLTGDWVDTFHSATTEGFGREVMRDLKLHERFGNKAVRN